MPKSPSLLIIQSPNGEMESDSDDLLDSLKPINKKPRPLKSKAPRISLSSDDDTPKAKSKPKPSTNRKKATSFSSDEEDTVVKAKEGVVIIDIDDEAVVDTAQYDEFLQPIATKKTNAPPPPPPLKGKGKQKKMTTRGKAKSDTDQGMELLNKMKTLKCKTISTEDADKSIEYISGDDIMSANNTFQLQKVLTAEERSKQQSQLIGGGSGTGAVLAVDDLSKGTVHSYSHTLIHSYTHALIHSYTHTLTHSYTHIRLPKVIRPP